MLGRLTSAERGVLELLLAGMTNARIAQTRGTTLRTVSKQVDAVYKKLAVHSRAELATRYGTKPQDGDGHAGG
jgi:DNA-binding NarL/FixJ family response regulator